MRLPFLILNPACVLLGAATAAWSGSRINISIRGKNIRDKVLKAIKELEDSTGGGHEDAVGAGIRVDDLEIFKKKLEELI